MQGENFKTRFSVSALFLTLTLNTGKTFEMALKQKKKTNSDIKAIRVRARMFMLFA